MTDDPRGSIDVLVNSAERAGLTGTAPASRYTPIVPTDQMTIAPDWRPAEDQPAWRRDFPIDWPEDQYVARRDFMKFMVLTSLALMVGQLWIGLQNWFRSLRGQPEWRRIASLADVPIGSSVVFRYPGEHDTCVLIRPSMHRLVAYSQKCTHLSCAVVPQPEKGVLHCPCHEGYFDLESGRPIAGPPRRPLPRILLEVRGLDVYAIGVEMRMV